MSAYSLSLGRIHVKLGLCNAQPTQTGVLRCTQTTIPIVSAGSTKAEEWIEQKVLFSHTQHSDEMCNAEVNIKDC